MASRSFKPPSYLTAPPSKRSPRASFTRSSSASSSKSDDSFINSLRTLAAADGNSRGVRKRDSAGSLGSGGAASPRCQTPLDSSQSSSQSLDDTPGRKRTQPIAIELPPRNPTVYTPLTARGDLPGGYFPNHESVPKAYNPHPFSRFHQENKNQSNREDFTIPPIMSNNSSAFASPSDTTPRAPPLILSPSSHAPEILSIPMGKYHPANFKLPKQAPTSAPSLPPTNLSLPSSIPDRKKKARPTHERHGSDVKRKLQEYQLGQAKQAQMLARAHGGEGSSISKPISPRLLPLGSPGPITPFELEDSTDAGYIIAGTRARSNLTGMSIERGGEELVGQMIRMEQNRQRMLGDEGSRSPVLSV